MDNMVEHIKGRCVRAGSLSALPLLDETIESVGIVGLEHLVTPLPPLPEGQSMTIEVVRGKNAEVLTLLRNWPANSPRPVYSLLKQTCHPDSDQLLAGRARWPLSICPLLILR
jgi:hypothetical protein